jgi:hypothetical protein
MMTGHNQATIPVAVTKLFLTMDADSLASLARNCERRPFASSAGATLFT